MLFAKSRTLSNDEIQHLGNREYPHCDCRSAFPLLRIHGRLFLKLTREHRCTDCRKLISEFATHNSISLLVEV